jgi:hypothetical protein
MLASVVAALVGGAATAYAGWSVTMPSATVTFPSAGLPVGSKPVATANGSDVSLSWPQVAIVPGTEVSKYRVIRSGNQGADHTVCETAARSCTDSNVPNGTWTYKIRPLQGTKWVGTAGAASDPVTVSHGNGNGNGNGNGFAAGSVSAESQSASTTDDTIPENEPEPTPTVTGGSQTDPTPDASPSESPSPTPTETTAASSSTRTATHGDRCPGAATEGNW